MYVYEIRHDSGKVYIGSTSEPSPVKRWYSHYNLLVNNKHHSESLQTLWNRSTVSEWAFRVCVQLAPDSSIKDLQATENNQLSEAGRYALNLVKNVTYVLDENAIYEQIMSGESYKSICERFSCSMATVSRIKKRRKHE